MHYDNFLEAIQQTQKAQAQRKPARKTKCQQYSSFSYSELRQRGDAYWLHLEKMNQAQLGQEIIDCFLNTAKWNCHLCSPGTPKGQQMVCNLQKALNALPAYYAPVQGLALENTEFSGNIGLQGTATPITSIIDFIYFSFLEIKPRFGRVPASKLMHMALPNLFMMWDNEIIDGYHTPKQDLKPLKGRKRSYTAFLMLMQENIRHLKATHPGGSGLTHDQLADQVSVQCGYSNLPMTRLLDIANYAVGKLGVSRCHTCVLRTNAKLNALAWSKQNHVGKF